MPLMMLDKFQMIDDIGFDDIGVRSIPSMGSGRGGGGVHPPLLHGIFL